MEIINKETKIISKNKNNNGIIIAGFGSIGKTTLGNKYNNIIDLESGYYIMNDDYFDEFLLQAIINKKYLSQKQLEALNQEYIDFELTDPF